MIRVRRSPEPTSLRENKVVWTAQLLHAIEEAGAYSRVSVTYKDRYRQDDVKESLQGMYASKCCYCEHAIGAECYEHIEHRKPKAVFHDLSFDWENLHWSCPKCNSAKRDHWDDANPILDAVTDSIDEHLSFDVTTGLVLPKTARGETTVKHANLNRTALVKARQKVIAAAKRFADMVARTTCTEDREFYRAELRRMLSCDPINAAEYVAFIRELILVCDPDLLQPANAS